MGMIRDVTVQAERLHGRRKKLRCVAIVTDKVLWRVVIGAMGLASQMPMQAFDSRAQAEAWTRLRRSPLSVATSS